MSRIAYIISAYKDAPHLARLVAALDDRADFYVHIDLNADIHPFEEALGDKVTFVPRHRISWGGWKQVEYQKELLAAVLHSGIPYTPRSMPKRARLSVMEQQRHPPLFRGASRH